MLFRLSALLLFLSIAQASAAFQLVADEVFEKLNNTVMNSAEVKDCQDSRRNCATIKSKAFFELYQSNTNALINTLNQENLDSGQYTLINLIQKNWLTQLTGKTYSEVLPLQRARLRVIIDLFNAYERDASEEVKAFVWRRLQMSNRDPERMDVLDDYLGFVPAHIHYYDRYGEIETPQKLIEFIKTQSAGRAYQEDPCKDTPENFRFMSDCPDREDMRATAYFEDLDANLNALYRDLKKKLDTDEFNKLRSIQRQWIQGKKPFEGNVGTHTAVTEERVKFFLELNNATFLGLSNKQRSTILGKMADSTESLLSGFPLNFKGLSKSDLSVFNETSKKKEPWFRFSGGKGIHPFCIAFEQGHRDYWEEAAEIANTKSSEPSRVNTVFWGNEGYYISLDIDKFIKPGLVRKLDGCSKKITPLFEHGEGKIVEEYGEFGARSVEKVRGAGYEPTATLRYSISAFVSPSGCQKLISKNIKCLGAAMIDGLSKGETVYSMTFFDGIWGLVEDKKGSISVIPIKTFTDSDAAIVSMVLNDIEG